MTSILFEPRPYQVPAFTALLQGRAKRIVTVWHRRAGKDLCAFNAQWIYASQHKANYGYFFPFAAQGRKAIWQGITSDSIAFREFIPPELVDNMHDTDMRITLTNGSTITFIGTDNIDAKMGLNFAGVVLSEYSLQDPRAWQLLSPILADNGGWAWFTYTPRGKENHGHTMYQTALSYAAEGNPRWHCSLLTVDDTGRIEAMREAIEEDRRNGMSDAMIQQEYWCSFEQENEGSYFGAQIQQLEDDGRLSQEIVWDPRELVHTGWDLGVNDSTVIWFFQRGRGSSWNVIDYFEANNQGLEFYLKMLSEKPYHYGSHIVPHDADQRHFPSITSTVDAAYNLGWVLDTVPKTQKRTQIDSTHRFLPQCWFNSSTCHAGIRALRNYERRWDERLKVFQETPLHNWASHPTDAFMTFVLGQDMIRDHIDLSNRQTHAEQSF